MMAASSRAPRVGRQPQAMDPLFDISRRWTNRTLWLSGTLGVSLVSKRGPSPTFCQLGDGLCRSIPVEPLAAGSLDSLQQLSFLPPIH